MPIEEAPLGKWQRLLPGKGIAAKTAGIVICKVFSGLAFLGFAAMTARQLGPSGRGIVVLLVTLASFALVICSLGINIGGRVLLVAPKDAVPLGDYLGLSLVLAAFDMAVCVAASFTLLPLVGIRLSPPDIGLFALLGGTLVLQKLLNEALVAYGHAVQASLAESGALAVLLLVTGSLVFFGVRDVSAYVVAFIVSSLIQGLGALIWLSILRPSVRLSGRIHQWTRLIRTGLPGIGLTMSQLLTLRVDRYLIGIFTTPAAVGIYSVAATAPEFIRLAPMALNQIIVHRIASGSATFVDFKRAKRLCLQFTFALMVVAFVSAPFVVELVFGAEFLGAVLPLRILLFGEIGIAFFSIDGAALMGHGRLRAIAIAATCGLTTVVAADLLLIPSYGLVGAAWASVIAYSIMGAMTLYLVRASRRPRQG